jgi:hypothetical protein
MVSLYETTHETVYAKPSTPARMYSRGIVMVMLASRDDQRGRACGQRIGEDQARCVACGELVRGVGVIDARGVRAHVRVFAGAFCRRVGVGVAHAGFARGVRGDDRVGGFSVEAVQRGVGVIRRECFAVRTQECAELFRGRVEQFGDHRGREKRGRGRVVGHRRVVVCGDCGHVRDPVVSSRSRVCAARVRCVSTLSHMRE